MIKEIKMKNCASYSSEGSALLDCAKVNFVYGPNGSGKSTISNYLRKPDLPLFSECSIEWDSHMSEDLVVYNQRFRKANFGTSDIPGVFTLGEGSIEELRQIETLKKKRTRLLEGVQGRRDDKAKKEKALSSLEDDFRESIWDAKDKEHIKVLRPAFTGLLNNKVKFRNEVISRYDKGFESADAYDVLTSKAESMFASTPEKMSLCSTDIASFLDGFTAVESNEVWGAVVVGNKDLPIGKLIQALGNSTWVSFGRRYITVGKVCPMCQSTVISQELKNQLDSFFDGEYDRSIALINELQSQYKDTFERLKLCIEAIKNNSDLANIGKFDSSGFETVFSELTALFNENCNLIEEKKIEPERKISLRPLSSVIEKIVQLVSKANSNIEKHNSLVDNLKKERQKLVDAIWAYFLTENSDSISRFKKKKNELSRAIQGMAEGIQNAEAEIETLNQEIIDAEKKVTSTQPTVDEINRMLKAYGFTNFSIAPSSEKENSYQIQRPNGELATDTLSEGEETFISFLYFMQLIKGSSESGHINNKKIIVLDDPICSLDSTVLYIVSAMVKDLIKQVLKKQTDYTQIFILTHNVFFHKEASFTNGKNKPNEDVKFWIIRKDEGVSSIKAYENTNPISTSYELLWKELKENNSPHYIVIQNIMRRIIENYFNMVGNINEHIIESFDSPEEQTICLSLIYWINDGSHSIPDDLYIDSYTPSTEKYMSVFRQVFEKTGNIAHYNMMMGIPDETPAQQ